MEIKYLLIIPEEIEFMPEIIYKKLIRDKIPEIIAAHGKKAIFEQVDEERFAKLLSDKLQEEMTEYKQSESVEELADIVEVVYAILENRGVSLSNFEKIRLKKVEERGAFKEKLFLEKVIE